MFAPLVQLELGLDGVDQRVTESTLPLAYGTNATACSGEGRGGRDTMCNVGKD